MTILRAPLRLMSGAWNAVVGAARRLRFLGRRIHVHPSSWVARRSVLQANQGGKVTIGRNCEIHPFSMLLAYGGQIHLGDDCSVNPFAILYGHGGLRIGNGVRIAAHCVIIPANHNPGTGSSPLRAAGISARGIVIEDNVWLGAGCCVLDGVRIGNGAIVGAGSVVTKSVAANATVAGVPARVISQR